jgi:drug/metabolite transporter (DMT)-like permease
MEPTRWQAYAVLGCGVTAVSWSAILVRGADAPALVIASYRLILAAAPMGLLAFWQSFLRKDRVPEAITTKSMLALVLSGAFLAAHFAFWIASLQHTSVVTAVVLMAMQPLIVGIASPLLLGESVHRQVWLALGVALAGVATMGIAHAEEGFGEVQGDIYAILGGFFAACYLIVGRSVRPDTSWLRYVGVVYPITAVFLFAVTLIAREPLTGYSAKTLFMIALMALGPQLIGHSSINWSLGYLPVMLVAMAILVEPVVSTILAALILDEWPSAPEFAGALLVLAGVYLALRTDETETVELEQSLAEPAVVD